MRFSLVLVLNNALLPVSIGFMLTGSYHFKLRRWQFDDSARAATTDQRAPADLPPYSIASVDLSSQWIDLVRNSKVTATVTVPRSDRPDATVNVRYGVHLEEEDSITCQDFMEQEPVSDDDKTDDPPDPLIESMAADLGLKFGSDGSFMAQLQLVRTLRPPPSPGFAEATTSKPPEYDARTDSFVSGPLRLQLRPLVATLTLPDHKLVTPWDVYHNVSPADTRGHFLLLPTLLRPDSNWRGQSLREQDCHDVVHLVASVDPVGSLLLGYNSVGAGASQNHIHLHAWPCPPRPLWGQSYAVVSKAMAEKPKGSLRVTRRFRNHGDMDHSIVRASWLDYPVFCIHLSSTVTGLDQLGAALAATLQAIATAPFNAGFLNRKAPEDDTGDSNVTDQLLVDVFVFVRSKERSSLVPTLKLGISEMMGLFHAQSVSELHFLVAGNDDHDGGVMERALQEVSVDNEKEMWKRIEAELQSL